MARRNRGLDPGRDVGRTDDVRAHRHHAGIETAATFGNLILRAKTRIGKAEAGARSMMACTAALLAGYRLASVRVCNGSGRDEAHLSGRAPPSCSQQEAPSPLAAIRSMKKPPGGGLRLKWRLDNVPK